MANTRKDQPLHVSIGLDLDSSKTLIERGSYTYALNSVLTERLFLQNESSNEKCIDFPEGYLPIGSVVVNEDIVHFLVNPDTNDSEIGITDKFCNYSTLINDACLNFNITKQIKAVYRPNSLCRRTIYWTDDYNNLRWLDIDDIPSPFDCDQIKVFSFTGHPCISIEDEVYEIGTLVSGVYQGSIQYADINGNGLSSVFGFTNPYPVIKANVSSGFNNIIGDPAGTPTNKAINFQFSNLSSDYECFNLIVLKTINGVQTPQKIVTLPISTTSYLYTGFEPSTITLTLADIIADPISYETAKDVIQVNNRLIWSNLTGKEELNYQSYANLIRVQWQVYNTPAFEIDTTYKNPWSTPYRRSLMRDEIYALGIRLLYKDGTKSCVYHIPGRAIDFKSNGDEFTDLFDQYGNSIPPEFWDSHAINIDGLNDDVYEGGIKERWEIYNTATIEGTDAGEDDLGCADYGEMSYYESTDLYPNDATIWGSLANQPIRHHKMPDCSIIHIHDGLDEAASLLDEPILKYLGLRISNVTIPEEIEDIIQGWEIVIGDRTYQRSIVAKGLVYSMLSHPTEDGAISDIVVPVPYFYQNYPYNDTDTAVLNNETSDSVNLNVLAFHSPDTSFKNIGIGNISEFKTESEEYGLFKHKWVANQTGTNIEGGGAYTLVNAHYGASLYSKYTQPTYTDIRRSINDKEYILNDSYQISFLGNVNNLERESFVMLYLDGTLNACVNNDDSRSVFTTSADVASGEMAARYVSIKRPSTNIYGQIDSITYLSTGMCPFNLPDDTGVTCFFGGDTYLTAFSKHIRDSFVLNEDDNPAIWNFGNAPANTDEANLYQYGMGVSYFWVEADVNCDYRYEGDTPKEYFYPNLHNNTLLYNSWLSPTYVWYGDDNYYLYNYDYSKLNNIKYNCIAEARSLIDCSNEYPVRSIYSEQNDEEGIVDKYLIYKPNNYFDYPKEEIEIWQTFSSQDTLFTRTKKSIFQHKLNFQQLQTDVSNIIVGTGALFAIPPVKMAEIDNGYGGTESQWCLNNTPYGIFMADQEQGHVFQLDSKLTEISQNKTYRYFYDNLPSSLRRDVDVIYGDGTYTGYDNPANPNGTGLISAWDKENKRWILTKKDYSIIDIDSFGPEGSLTYEDGVFYLDEEPVSLDNTDLFCNKSFTISFSPITQRWISFHSYLPNTYTSTKNGFLSTTGESLWKHNITCSYQTFYDVLKPFIIEITDSGTGTDNLTFAGIEWSQENETCISDTSFTQTYEKVTFNKGYVYNDFQHSGTLELLLQDDNDLSTINNLRTSINYSDREGTFRFSDIWDINKYQDKQVNLNTNDCTNEDYIAAYPIDKVPNDLVLNYGLEWYEKQRFRNNWISYRLIQDDRSDHKIITNFFNINSKKSLR